MANVNDTNREIDAQNAAQDMAYKRVGVAPGSVNTSANLNPNVASAVNQQIGQAQMTPEQIAQRSMAGVGDKAGQLPNAESSAQQIQGLGGGVDAGMQAAINNRQNKLFDSHLNDLGTIAKIQARGTQAEQQSAGMAAAAAQEDLKTQAANTQLVKYQNDVAQRNSILNSVLGLGGAIAGMLLPKVGAAAGSMLAQGAGKMLQPQGGNTGVQGLDSGGQGSAQYFGGKG